VTARSEQGPVESWLTTLLNESMSDSTEIAAQVVSVDLSASSKLGEVRAYVSFSYPATPDRTAWGRLSEILSGDPSISRVVAVPPAIHVTLAPGVIESGLDRLAAEPLIPERPGEPGVVVVFCSPNTNKPLHIGHLRACFVGMSVARLFEATGAPVARSQMLSNYGIHMCQALSMHDGAESPESVGVKGDHFVGDLYRRYHEDLARVAGPPCDDVECGLEAGSRQCTRCRPIQMLRQMQRGDPELIAASRRLGEWAIDGILATQARVGTTHDVCLRESAVIADAVKAIERAVEAGVCQRREDGSIYIPVRSTGEADLTLLRSDGTTLVFSMLLGIYIARGALYPGWKVVELTGEQWRAGRTAMYEILRRVGRKELAATTEGVFFGMVRLQGQVMRSRAGTVFLADSLVDDISERVAGWEAPRGGVPCDEAARDRLAVALLKYHVLRFKRAKGFDFDVDTMWNDATTRFGAVLRALTWAEQPCTIEDRAEFEYQGQVRSLSLALARQSAYARRALEERDPSVMVRYVDDVVEKVLAVARRGQATHEVRRAVSLVLRGSLALLDIDLHSVRDSDRAVVRAAS
jgi:arginyl-tRNA synthetase